MATWHNITVERNGATTFVTINDSHRQMVRPDGSFVANVDGKTVVMKNLNTPHGCDLSKFKFTQNGGITVQTSKGEFPARTWELPKD